MGKLPEWFDWKDYHVLYKNEDWAFWEHEFCIRDPNYEKEMEAGLAVADFISGNTVERKMLWENGILSYGMKGHATRKHMDALIKTYAYISNAKFIPEAVFQKLQKEDKLTRGHIYTTHHARTVGDELGYLEFNSKDEYDVFDRKARSLFDRTVSLAFNIDMPEDVLVQQFKKLIKHHKKRRQGGINRRIISKGTAQRWAIGLACWDLKNRDRDCKVPTVTIARELIPMLPEENRGRKEDTSTGNFKKGSGERKIRNAIKDVEKEIDGGWKILSGDPYLSFDYSSKNKK